MCDYEIKVDLLGFATNVFCSNNIQPGDFWQRQYLMKKGNIRWHYQNTLWNSEKSIRVTWYGSGTCYEKLYAFQFCCANMYCMCISKCCSFITIFQMSMLRRILEHMLTSFSFHNYAAQVIVFIYLS